MSEIEEEPLDPAVEAIRVKMVRLLMVSGGIMMLGLMAVLAAIVYKINKSEVTVSAAPPATTEKVLTIPKGAQIVNTSASGDNVVLHLKLGDGSVVIRIHQRDGRLLSSYSVREE